MEMTSCVFAGKNLFVNARTGNVKLTSRGKAMPIGKMLASMDKGTARRFRKSMRSAGLPALAGAAREAA